MLWLLTLLAAAPCTDPASLDWLEGAWTRDEAGTRHEEHWMAPAGGELVGMARTVSRQSTGHEFLRIALIDGGLTYLASPEGRQPPTPFLCASQAPDKVVFSNPQHDFPQTIGYARNGDQLTAWIQGADPSKRITWTFARSTPKPPTARPEAP